MFEFLSQKNLFLGQKVWKKIGNVLKKFGKVWQSSAKFGNWVSECLEISEIGLFQTFQKLQKMMLNSNFGNRKNLVPTRNPTKKFS